MLFDINRLLSFLFEFPFYPQPSSYNSRQNQWTLMPLKIERDIVVRLGGAAGGSYGASLPVIRDIGGVGNRKSCISSGRPADPATYYPGIEALRSCLDSRIQGGIACKSQVELASPHTAELVIGGEIKLVRRG